MTTRSQHAILWVAVIVCSVLGISAVVGRTRFPDSFGQRAVPERTRLMEAMGRSDPPGTDRLAETRIIDLNYGRHLTAILVHVIPGGAFMLLAPLQLVRRVRRSYPAVHRWNGRIIVTAAFASLPAGLFFGIAMPIGGRVETLIAVIFGVLMLFALARAVIAIRRGDVTTHREWMLRAISIGFGISVVRLVSAPLDVWLAPNGVPVTTIFVLSLVLGWGMSIGVAEWWIRATRAEAAGGA